MYHSLGARPKNCTSLNHNVKPNQWKSLTFFSRISRKHIVPLHYVGFGNRLHERVNATAKRLQLSSPGQMRPRMHPLHTLLVVGAIVSSNSNEPVEGESYESYAYDPNNFLGGGATKNPKGNTTCRVAVCFSGHVRSFVYPVVYVSARRNLVDAIKAQGCQVDVFAYATLTDVVSSFKTVSVFAGLCLSLNPSSSASCV